MAYDNIIDRSGASALMPEEESSVLLTQVTQESACMRLARRLADMDRAQRRMPVISALPTAYFSSGDNSLKQTTEVSWSNVYIDAEELDVIVPIPNTVLDDAEYDIWGQVRPRLAEAIGVAIDQAVFYGTNIPATWQANLGAAGLVARATAAGQVASLASFADPYEALLGESSEGAADGLLMLLEADGFMATGHVAHTSVKGLLRNTRDADGQPIFHSGQNVGNSFQTGELDGSPVLYPLNGSIDDTQSLMISGAWNSLVYAMRKDINYRLSVDGVIQGPAGNIVYNLFQQNMTAVMATIRLGFSLPNIINRMNTNATTRCQFAVLTA